MKYFLLLFFYFFTTLGLAQTYTVIVDGRLPSFTSSSGVWGDGTISVKGGDVDFNFKNFDRGGDLRDNVIFRNELNNKTFTSLTLRTDYFPLPPTSACTPPNPAFVTYTLDDFFPAEVFGGIGFTYCPSFFSVEVIPEMTITGPTNTTMCAGSTIDLKNDENFPANAYKTWSFRLKDPSGNSISGGGKIDDKFYTPDKKGASFNMIDLLGEDIVDNIGNTVEFYIGFSSTYPYSNFISIVIDDCTPFLDGQFPQNTSCSDLNDGAIELAFRRDLDMSKNERLLIEINDTPDGFTIPDGNEFITSLSASSNGANTFTITNLAPGSYEIQYQSQIIIDSNYEPNGLGIPIIFEILGPSAVVIDNVVLNKNPTCPGEFGIRTIQASGGREFKVGQYHFTKDGGSSWDIPADPNSTEFTYNDLIPDNDYTFGVKLIFTDGSGECVSADSIDQTIPDIPNPITLATGSGVSKQPSNAAATDGIIFAQVTNGLPNFTFELYAVADPLNPISSTPTQVSRTHVFEDLGIGFYFVKITDANGCEVNNEIAPFELTAAALPTLSAPSPTNPTCNGENDGSVSVDVTYPTPTTFLFQLRDGPNVIRSGSIPNPPSPATTSGTITIENLASGNYFLDVVSDFGDFTIPATVVVSDEIIIANPAAVSIDTFTPNNISCFGGTDGSISLTVSGGNSYEYTNELIPAPSDWLPLIGNTIENLSGGFYYLTIRNENGCQSSTISNTNILIREPNIIDVAVTSSPASTNGGFQGSISLGITEGTPFTAPENPYNITWTKQTTGPPMAFADTDPSTPYEIIGLEAATYRATIADANGCNPNPNPVEIIITEPGPLSIDLPLTGTDTCNGINTGTITATVQGTGELIFEFQQPLGNTVYTITTTDRTVTAPNLGAGSYALRIEEVVGGNNVTTIPADYFTIMELAQVEATVTPTDATCAAPNSGSITITGVTGGSNSGYTYVIDGFPPQDTGTFSGLSPRGYIVTITDALGCEYTETVTVGAGELPNIDLTNSGATSPSVIDGNDGFITLNFTNTDITGFTYQWNGPGTTNVTTQNLTNIEAGIYSVVITGEPGCSITRSFNVPDPDPQDIVPTVTTIDCKGNDTGAIDVTIIGELPNSYQWTFADNSAITTSNGTIAEDISGLVAGTYVLTITYPDNSTFRSRDIEITEPTDEITAIPTTITNVTCNGGNDGSITITASGGTGTLLYSLDGVTFQTDNTFSNLIADTYTITVSDVNGCAFQTTGTVDEPTIISISDPVKTNITSAGGADGAISFSVTGGSGAYIYTWLKDGQAFTPPTGSTNTSLIGLQAGVYDLTVSDSTNSNCSITLTPSITLIQPGPLSIDSLIPTAILCKGEATGSITATVTGDGPFIYIWERVDNQAITSVNSSTISGLPAGEYRLRVTDQSTNPEISDTITINEPALDVTAIVTPTDTSCFGANDGSISINASGGTAGYTYSLDGATPQTNNTFSNLIADTYTITVSDVNDCEFQTTGTVGEPTIISISDPVKTNITSAGGADGAISFSVTGSSGAYIYTWLKDGEAFTPPTGSTDTSLIGLQAGIYDLTVSDSTNSNCSITLTPSISLTQPGPLSIDSLIPTPILCKGEATGSITAAVTGTAPFSYVWERVDGQAITSVNNATIAGLSAGEYRLRLTDDSTNPEITDTIIIEEPTLDLTATVIPTDSSCFGANDGTIVINASGGTAGYSYSLDGVTFQANNTFTDLIANTYTITVIDANDCEFEITEVVGEPNEIIVTDQITNTTLNGSSDGAISINIAGGTPLFETLWSGPNGFTSTLEDITNLTAGVYTLEVRDANHTIDASGCYFTQDYTVTEPAALIITNIVTTDTNCFDEANGSITTTVSGEGTITYEWTLADGSPVPVSNGTNAEDITGIIAGSYILTVTDDNISVTSPIITINGPTIALTIQNANGINSTCNGEDDGSIEVFASGGTAPYQYSINGVDFQNSPTFTNLTPGQYTITVLDSNNCTDVLPTPVLITEPVVLNFTINEQRALSAANASDGVIAITPSGGSGDYTYSWTGPNFTSTDRDIFGLDSGDYFLTLTDATNTNCTLISAAITIAEPGVLIATTTQTVLLECNGDDFGEITANVQGGVPPYTYEWFEVINGNNNQLTEDTEIIANLTSGTYFVRVTDANGIVVVAANPTIINEPELLRIVIDNTTDVLCNGEATGAISISVTGGTQPYQYFWSNGDTVEDINNLSAGEFLIEVIDGNGCIAEENISISAPTSVVQIANAIVTDVATFQGSDGSIQLDIIGGLSPYTIVWGRDSDNANVGNQATISNLTADSYAVSITDANGCNINANYEITQPDIVEETIIAPTCTGESNGSISVLVNQGNGTFNYSWSTGATTNTITNLPADTYSVTITGFEDGPITRTYELIDPLPLDVNLGANRVLCADQILELNATVTDETASYLWSSDTGFTSTLPNVTLTESGNYTVVVTSQTGCTAQGNIAVDISTDEIDAEFAISSQVFEGEDVLAVDISFPLPESIVWQVPEGATVVTQNSDELVLVFETEGEYEIGITTTRGDCIATKTKKVLVVKRDPLTEEDKIKTEKVVEDFLVYPNPTTGKFTADVSLTEPGNISIKVFNLTNNAMIASERGRGITSYSIPFDISAMPSGVYAVLLETPYGTSLRKIVVR